MKRSETDESRETEAEQWDRHSRIEKDSRIQKKQRQGMGTLFRCA